MDQKEIIVTLESAARQEFESSIREMTKVFFGYYCSSSKIPDKKQAMARFKHVIAASSQAYDDVLKLTQQMEDQLIDD